MKTLYLRIYLTVVAVLRCSRWCRAGCSSATSRGARARRAVGCASACGAWAELIQRSLPGADAPARGTGRGAARLVAAAAPAAGARRRRTAERIAASDVRSRDARQAACRAAAPIGSTTAARCGSMRPGPSRASGRRPARRRGDGRGRPAPRAAVALVVPPAGPTASGWCVLLVLLFVAVAAGAWPVVRAADAAARGAEARRRAFGAGAAEPARRRGRAATRSPRSPRASTAPPPASRRWCARTRACWPTPATNCARRWRA